MNIRKKKTSAAGTSAAGTSAAGTSAAGTSAAGTSAAGTDTSAALPRKYKKKIILENVENFKIPTYNEYEIMKSGNNKYNLVQLKEICRHYKQKITGRKEQLAENLYTYLYNSKYALIIQRAWRKYYIKVYNRLRGPARFKRSLCVNETDFCSLEPLNDISYLQFFSYQDTDDNLSKKNKVIYGFEILSLFNLMKNEYGQANEDNLINPYTREPFPDKAKLALFKLIRKSKTMNEKIKIRNETSVSSSAHTSRAPSRNNSGSNLRNTTTVISRENNELRTVGLFNAINDLGNYTSSAWFSELGHTALLRLIRELYDIWMYRANLSENIKREICPQNGNPFRAYHLDTQIMLNLQVEQIRHYVLEVLEVMVYRGINRDSRYLGANYVLCALTLVSSAAAESLPWLYQSVI